MMTFSDLREMSRKPITVTCRFSTHRYVMFVFEWRVIDLLVSKSVNNLSPNWNSSYKMYYGIDN